MISDALRAALEVRIAQGAQQIAERLKGKFVAILLTGAAARSEATFGPEGSLLSDLDFLIVLPQCHVATALLRERSCRLQLRGRPPEVLEKASIGFANAVPRYWLMLTPLMWELRTNSRVLYGLNEVKTWPVISRADQIPGWEGIRLIANRLCELLGAFGVGKDVLLNNLADPAVRNLQYASLKMILAGSEAQLIEAHLYKASYRERYQQHRLITARFTTEQNDCIEAAYQAKLGLGLRFFETDIDTLVEAALEIALATLYQFDLTTPEALEQRVYAERALVPGLAADVMFWVGQSLAGKRVPLRRAIASVYGEAFRLGLEIVDQGRVIYNDPALGAACRDLARRFKETPQRVSSMRITRTEGFHAQPLCNS